MNEQPTTNPFDEDEKSGRRPIAWALLGIVAVGCGLLFATAFIYFQPDARSLYTRYFPSPTLTPSPTNTPTPTLTPTPTRTATPTPNFTATAKAMQATGTAIAYQATAENAANNWKVILMDTFDSNENDWLVKSSDDEYALTTYEILEGKYRWDMTAHKSFIGWVRPDRKKTTNFYLSVEIQKTEGSDTADYGVIFREDDDSNFYYFGINDQGEYVLYLFFEKWDTLINWKKTELIRPAEVNRLTVIGEGSHFTFFINDQYLTEFTDDKIPLGSTALAIELSEENDHAIFEFDNFELRIP
jgi:hypothetical protein